MANSAEENGILRFFTQQPSPRPTLDTILSWSDEKLEHKHDYIQILFPLPEASMFHIAPPLITRAVFHAFRTGPARHELRRNLRRAFDRMMAFYGFAADPVVDPAVGDPLRLRWAANHAARFRAWARPFDHNHLRLTRILRSLRVLGLAAEAAALHVALVALANAPKGRALGARSRAFWARAATWPLHVAPDDDRHHPRHVLAFLREFDEEEEQRRAQASEEGEAGADDGEGGPEAVTEGGPADANGSVNGDGVR